ncbi:hypothetical protein EBB07_00105 [Paenibacillaceae bacterium]|nr:hypothetical protein EBB07_00105 [Paenibacillaceae bacterium]
MKLTPAEILFLSSCNQREVNNKKYSGYWSYKYNLNPVSTLSKLILQGWLIEKIDLERNLNKSKLDELKLVAKKYSLVPKGNKSSIIDDLLKNVPNEDLKGIFKEKILELSLEAKELVQSNKHINFFHSNPDIATLEEVHNYKLMNLECNNFEIALYFLEKKLKTELTSNNWSLSCGVLCKISYFERLNKNYEKSLTNLLKAIVVTLSGLENGFNLKYLAIYSDGYFPYKSSLHTITNLIPQLVELQETTQIKDDVLKEKLIFSASEMNLPFQMFTLEEMVDIIYFEKSNKTAKLNSLYNFAKKRMTNSYSLDSIDLNFP